MIKLGTVILPTIISVNQVEGNVTLNLPHFITDEFVNCVDFNLHFTFMESCVEIDYKSEEDNWLWLVLGLDDTELAVGDLAYETFEAIQERALKVLCKYIENDQKEMLEHFRDL